MQLHIYNIKTFVENISNYMYEENVKAAIELIELLDRLAKKPLETPMDYVEMYDNNFYTYMSWKELVDSETVIADGLSEEQCKEELNKSIWQLPCGWYVQYV